MQSKTCRSSNARLHALIADALTADPAAAGFQVHYQPIVRIDGVVPVAVEALARWHHPVAGWIEPQLFVQGAEHVGLMGVLDDFVLNRACAEVNALADAYGHELHLHVNVSASRLGRSDLDAAVAWALQRHQLRPDRLVLEITETARIASLDAAAACVQRIRDRGVHVALDDFGSGFNALKQLHALPVDLIKLDAALTSIDVGPWRTEALCRSVMTICDQMGLTVIAEGLETAEQALVLQRLGCQLGQGYLYGRPSGLERTSSSCRRACDSASA
jgi:diguanylate cyclase